MGETRNESSGFRKARDHPPGRALPPAGATDAANTRHPVLDILPMVCALPDRRAGGARRQTVEAGSGLESHPRRGARTHHRDGPGRAGVVAARTRHLLHRCRRLFCLGILGVSIAQGARLDCESGLRRDQGSRRVQGQDYRTQSALADRLHLSEVIGWGWFYLSTILDDFSRYIIAWKLCTTMKAADVADTLRLALTASGCDQARVIHKPRLLSDNGSSYVSGDLAEWLVAQGIGHVRGAPNHPQTQGKIERWHRTLKNRILLENYYLPGDLEAHIGRFVEHYNHQRYHESLKNLTPADVYFGRGQTILRMRERIKRDTIQNRRLRHQNKAA